MFGTFARVWADNWRSMLPYLVTNRRLVPPTPLQAMTRFVNRPQRLLAFEREFSAGDPVLVRTALFSLLHSGAVVFYARRKLLPLAQAGSPRYLAPERTRPPVSSLRAARSPRNVFGRKGCWQWSHHPTRCRTRTHPDPCWCGSHPSAEPVMTDTGMITMSMRELDRLRRCQVGGRSLLAQRKCSYPYQISVSIAAETDQPCHVPRRSLSMARLRAALI